MNTAHSDQPSLPMRSAEGPAVAVPAPSNMRMAKPRHTGESATAVPVDDANDADLAQAPATVDDPTASAASRDDGVQPAGAVSAGERGTEPAFEPAEQPECRQIRNDGTEEDCGRSAVWLWMAGGAGSRLARAPGAERRVSDSHATAAAPASAPPPMPSLPAPPAPAVPTVTINAPALTNDNRPPISGTAPAGGVVDVYEGAVKLGSATADSSGNWSLTPSHPLADGRHTLTSKVTDASGNVGSMDVSMVIDTVAPEVTISAPALTNDNTPPISGTAPANSVVDIFEGGAKLGSATVDASGHWRLTPAQPLADGTHTLTSKVTDAAGNVGSTEASVVVDTVAPEVTISAPVLTHDNTPPVSGTAPADGVVDVYEGTVKLGSATADSSGHWSLTPSQPLADGTHTLTSKVTDAAGNVGSMDASVVVDTVAPEVTISAPALTSDNTPPVSGTAPADGMVDVYEGTVKLGSATADSSGHWSLTPSQPLADGTHTLTSKVTDAAGNVGSMDASVVVDTVAPEVTISAPALTNDNTPPVSGTAPADGMVDVYEGMVKLGSTTADSSGHWSLTPSQPLADGTHTLTSKVTDAAGNVGWMDASVVVDTVAPTVTIAAPSLINNHTPEVSGVSEVGSRVDIFDGSNKLGSTTTDAAGNWNFTPFLADGSHTLTARATDAAGNEGAAAVAPVIIDTQAPSVVLVVAGVQSPAYGDFGWVGDTSGSSPVYFLETGASWFYRINGEPDWHQGSGTSFQFSGLHEGANSIELYQEDQAGNVGASQVSQVGLDTIAPGAVQLAPSKSGDLWLGDSIQISHLENGANWDYRINGGTWQSGHDQSLTFTRSNMVFGDALVEVRQHDLVLHDSPITSLHVNLAPPVI